MTPPAMERLRDLLADRAIAPLELREDAELAELLAANPGEDDLAFDRIVATVQLAGPQLATEPLPPSLARRLHDLGEAWSPAPLVAGRIAAVVAAPRPAAPSAPAARRGAWLPWLVAAAAVVLLAVRSWPDGRGAPATPRPSNLYAELATLPDTRTLAWREPGAEDVDHGDVVWNTARQAGVMRLRGLAANDPAAIQYQLWIFDDSRAAYSENIAVDGGVFDVDAATGDVFVLVRPALRVVAPSLFAITTEPPGGVVKHNAAADPERYRIVLTAIAKS